MLLKRYPEYKSSRLATVGSIPHHWIERRAKYFFSEIDDRSVTGSEEMLSVSHIRGVTRRKLLNVSMFQAESNEGHKLCRSGDVVINTMWAWMAALGVSNEHGVVSPSYGVYRPKNLDIYNSYFLDRLLRIETYRAEYVRRSTGIRSSRLRLYPDKFLGMPVLCPPYEEQRKIAIFLKYIDSLSQNFIRNKKKKILLLKEQKQVIIREAVNRGIDPNVRLKPSGVNWLGDIPEHWEIRRLKNVAKIKNGQDHKQVEANQGFPVIGSGGQFSSASKFLYNGESILFGRKGTIDKPIYMNGPFWTIDTMFYSEVSKDISAKFLYYCSTGFQFKYYSTHTALPSMTQEDLGKHPLALPPLEEQLKIVHFIEEKMALYEDAILKCQREIDLIQEYRNRLISDAVTGKIDVRDVKIDESSFQDTIDGLIEPEEIEESLELVGVADEDD